MPRDAELLLSTTRFRVERVVQPTTKGGRAREIVRHPGAVAILPLVDDAHVCLIRNFRISVDRYLIEIPAGTLEPGEAPIDTATRELAEETGYRAASIQPLSEFVSSPGVMDERMHLFVATGLTAGPAAREAGEEIENLVVTYAEALEMIRDGRIQDAKTIVALLFYDRWHGG